MSVNTGMITTPMAALEPFFNDSITITPHTQRDNLAKPIELQACVMEADPYSLGDGFGPDGSKPTYSAMVRRADIPDGVSILPGAMIAKSATHPRMEVRSVHANGPALWMDCVSTEVV